MTAAAATRRADSLLTPAAQAAAGAKKAGKFPITLDEAASVAVRRPVAAKRSEAEKASREEVLVIDGIEVDRDVAAKFDVFVNAEDHAAVGSGGRELAGSFVNVPHRHGHGHGKKGRGIKTTLRLALNEQLEDLKAEDDESVEVTLVPRQGKGKVKVGGVRIELMH